MYGLSVSGKTYNPLTYEISRESVLAKVIDIGTSSVRFWPNGSGEVITVPIDVLFCSPWRGSAFSISEVVIIPFYLLDAVYNSTIDTSISYLVSGPKTNFQTTDGSDFTESQNNYTIGLIKKCKCPVIFWENNFNPRIVGVADFLMGYEAIYNPFFGTYSYNTAGNPIFIEENKATFISPTYTGPAGPTGASEITGPQGSPGIQRLTGPTDTNGSTGSTGTTRSTWETGATGVTRPGFNTIVNPGTNRILVSDNTTTGAIAQPNLIFDETTLKILSTGSNIDFFQVGQTTGGTPNDHIFSVNSKGYTKTRSIILSGLSATGDIFSIDKTSGGAAFYEYHVYNSLGAHRAGTIIAVWDPFTNNVQYTEIFTPDLSNLTTSGISFIPSIISNNITLTANISSGIWNVILSVRLL